MSALGFKARVDFCVCASFSECNGLLRFTSGATPAGLLVVSMTAKLFLYPYTCTCTIIGGFESGIQRVWQTRCRMSHAT